MNSAIFTSSRRRAVAVVTAWVVAMAAAMAVTRALDAPAGLERAPVCVESPVHGASSDGCTARERELRELLRPGGSGSLFKMQ